MVVRLSIDDSSKFIHILQYTDAFAIITKREELLQMKFDILQIYYWQRKLCDNISKKNIVIFHVN